MAKHTENGKVREATVAGIFYPEDSAELAMAMGRLIASAEPGSKSESITRARAIVSPHAGLGYSGDLSALAWKSACNRKIDRVVILSPLHRAEESLVYLPEADYFATPIGPVQVDKPSVEELLDCGTAFSMNDIPHFEEHGIEVQLPFLRTLFPEASLVPILVGKAQGSLVKSLASALGIVFGDKAASTLFVVSSDLSAGLEAASVGKVADQLLALIAQRDADALLDFRVDGVQTACGAVCLAAYLASPLAEGARSVLLGRHDSSKSRESEQERLVEYAALAFL
jgi:AmmeMemoRadiSam system protein B